MRINDLTPDEVHQVIHVHSGRWYIQERIGTDEQTRWELVKYRIGGEGRKCIVRCYQRVYSDRKWVLSVTSDYVEPRDRNSADGMVWEFVADTYEEVWRVMKFQGMRREGDDQLICPKLPAVGWCEQYGPYRWSD